MIDPLGETIRFCSFLFLGIEICGKLKLSFCCGIKSKNNLLWAWSPGHHWWLLSFCQPPSLVLWLCLQHGWGTEEEYQGHNRHKPVKHRRQHRSSHSGIERSEYINTAIRQVEWSLPRSEVHLNLFTCQQTPGNSKGTEYCAKVLSEPIFLCILLPLFSRLSEGKMDLSKFSFRHWLPFCSFTLNTQG